MGSRRWISERLTVRVALGVMLAASIGRRADGARHSGSPTPTAVAIPSPDPGRSADPRRDASAAPPTANRAEAAPPAMAINPTPPPSRPLDATYLVGRTIEPIDLVNVLRLAGARQLDIAIARQRIAQALADLSRARALWLPSLFIGPTYYRADGQVQTAGGQVQTINRSSLYLGGTASLANGFPSPSPGTGYPQLNGLSSVLRISDSIFEPMAARRVANATRAGLVASINDALLEVAEAYLDLQEASGRLAIASEAAGNAERLAEITGSYVKAGQGNEADRRRALTELKHQRKTIQLASGQLLVASTNITRLLVLDTRLVVAPLEPAEAVIRLIPDEVPLDGLVLQGFQNRPELAQSRELVQAAIVRLKQARLRPFIPSIGATYGGGGLGGGANSFFGDFGARGDFMGTVFWELQNLGFTDLAIMRRNAASKRVADLELLQVETRVAADVAAAYEQRMSASRQLAESRETVFEAVESLNLNFINMQQGAGLIRSTRPIEVLQPIQALAQARLDYLDSVIAYNRSQFRLKRSIGQQP